MAFELVGAVLPSPRPSPHSSSEEDVLSVDKPVTPCSLSPVVSAGPLPRFSVPISGSVPFFVPADLFVVIGSCARVLAKYFTVL